MLKWMTAGAVGLLMLGCNAAPDKEAPKAAKSGITTAWFDTSVSPREDFFRYANGTWLDTVEIPADKSLYSSFSELSDANDQRIRTIIEEAAATPSEPGTPGQQLGDFYKAYMNTDLLDEKGYDPIKPLLEQVDAAMSAEDLARLFGQFTSRGIGTPVAFFISIDAKNADRYSMHLSQSGLSLPDRDYYLDPAEKMAEIRTAYKAHVALMLGLIGSADGAADAETVFDIEHQLAEYQWTRVEARDRNKTYNKMTRAELVAGAPGFPWDTFLSGLQAAEGDIIVRQPSFVTAFAALYPKVSLNKWKTYYRWHLVNAYAGLLSKPFRDAEFNFYEKTLTGVPEERARWKRAVDAANNVLGEQVGKIYVEKHFRPEAKARMKELVDNLIFAYGRRLDLLDWMSPETKKEAHAKLAKFQAKIGYPDTWRDFSGLEIKADDLVGNYMRQNAFEYKRDLDRLDKPVDTTEWFMTPQTVNAYYSSTRNEIVFPAAILQPPFFDLEADAAANYGAIGAVIGHEITHGFDDQGRKSDGNGNLRDWWTDADGKEFDARASRMVAQYDAYQPLPDEHVNGKLTLGENIADLGGLTVAYHAYKHSLNGQEAPVIDGFTGEQRLFLSWAQTWRRKYREEELRRRLATDSHSPGRYRTEGPVSNMPEFYEAFGVKEGDAMYRAPEARIKIW